MKYSISLLEDIRCPSCGSEGPLYIWASVKLLVWDDKSQYEHDKSNETWDEDSETECQSCGHPGALSEFYAPMSASDIESRHRR